MSDNTEKPEKKLADLKSSVNKSSGSKKQSKKTAFPIVGIGGSAGSFQAFEKFFTHMPADSGMAFVIIMHLDPNHKGQVSELIRKYSPMPVLEAIDGMPVEADHIYIIPPNKDMGIHNRKLLLLNVQKPNGYRQPIDYFLQSLADDQWNKSVGIIFSGMGSDGETGVRMVKEKLGMVMVQDPETAPYSSMPIAAIGTNLVDYVLSPEEMPMCLIQYLNHPVLSEEPSEQARMEIRNSTSVQKVLMLLRSHTGHDFSLYKKSTIVRRIDRRVAYHQLPDYVHYVNYLRENPQEVDVLFNELLIGVTKFFRDAAAFESLKNKLQPIIQQKSTNEPVRVWIAGCSTGEEAYSIAMLLIECLDVPKKAKLPKIQIFATDLDAEAIEHARAGVYNTNIVADVSPERITRFFIKNEANYTVKKELREMIVFAQHNLIKDAPFTRLDLLCCRNVMIYLTAELQKKIIPVFHYSLNPKAIMFMGPAETIGGFTEMFVAVDPKWKIFERKEGSAAINRMIDFPFHVAKQPNAILRIEEGEKIVPKVSIADTFNKIMLENFTPTSVLINDKGDILYSNGRTGKFLELPSGEAMMNIYKMIREELRYVLGNVIHQARSQKALVTINDIKLKEGDQVRTINLKASLLMEKALEGLLLIVFEDKGLFKKPTRQPTKGEAGHDKAIEELEKELVYTKEQLSNTIEQMETSLEELKSTNEELQSTNEELQSTNEELQSTNEESLTTKEEMQSLNEELMTINVQYQAKAEELAMLNNDMKNLLDSTEIGTIFLNNNMEVLRYTPPIRKLFSIIPSDVGRPLSHIVSAFDYRLIEENVKEVIERLAIKEVELKTQNNDWYNVRILPYRTLDNFISGAVLTFTLITNYKQMEYRLNALQNYSADIINVLQEPALQLDKDLQVVNVNQRFMSVFKVKEREIKGYLFDRFVHEHWKTIELDKLLQQCRNAETSTTTSFKVEYLPGENFELTARPFINENVNEPLLLLILIIIHEL
ncbi:chemotaxis protein CheR [Mucilaginibacter robiniae]|uniref:protein-glutamate O-methyltransferase n=1 Tax=Mucilaginibacter robiniae TaxID=2728022 RepID=A0A7L5E4N2_9SPHI|nr:CheR family methyltransferase [Mucilaginibacter robiniae]QJD96684.1 chemotaxis protein CheR [Mucilaginibacter robiniae]